ncbi:hypothetical protein BDV93DRAFT_565535 [Ceratobasidium sp. AG-I]|nr:hypothetical protein BDV93DRAFT_565535 [Ceratobasidium sp. AG-I]
MPPPSFLDRMLRRKSPLESYLKETYEFVVGNYQAGDTVMILDTIVYLISVNLLARKNRHTAIRQLAAALDRGFLHKSRGAVVGERIPIKCVFLRFLDEDLRWSGVDQLLSDLPSTVENKNSGSSAYAIERGLYGQIKRKELWHSQERYAEVNSWILLQTGHIIPYGPDDFVEFKYNPKDLLNAVTYPNCMKRRHGLPHDDAISTGGQLVRIVYATESYPYHIRWLVWSSQCFAEGESGSVSRTRPFGPKSFH